MLSGLKSNDINLVRDLTYFVLQALMSKCLKNWDFSKRRSSHRVRVFGVTAAPGIYKGGQSQRDCGF